MSNIRKALEALYSVVIARNRAGADWGEQFNDLMTALGLASAALAQPQAAQPAPQEKP